MRPVCIQFVCARTPESELCLFAVFHTTFQHHKSVFEVVCSSQSSLHHSSLKFKVCESSFYCIDLGVHSHLTTNYLLTLVLCLRRSAPSSLHPHSLFGTGAGAQRVFLWLPDIRAFSFIRLIRVHLIVCAFRHLSVLFALMFVYFLSIVFYFIHPSRCAAP